MCEKNYRKITSDDDLYENKNTRSSDHIENQYGKREIEVWEWEIRKRKYLKKNREEKKIEFDVCFGEIMSCE